MIWLAIKSQIFEPLELRYIFHKIGPEQKQTNVGHSENYEIINGNPKNINCNVKKCKLAFKRNRKSSMI